MRKQPWINKGNLFFLFLFGILVISTIVCAQEDDDPNIIVYRGKILNEQGVPVSGAQISVYDFPEKLYLPYSGVSAGKVTSNNEGRFSFSRFRAVFDEIYATIGIIQAEGYAVLCFDYTTIKKDSPIILSSKIGSISGQVVDSQGQPVPGATVAAFFQDPYEVSTTDIPAFTRQTDAEGHFSFENFSLTDKVNFFAVKKGYAGSYTFRTDDPRSESKYSVGQRDVRLVLNKEASLSGKLIRHDTGLPLAGETLSTRRYQGKGGAPLFSYNVINGTIDVPSLYSPTDSCTLKTDAQGCFSLPPLMPGTYTIFHHNFQKGLFTPKISVELEEGQHRDIIIEAIPGIDVILKGATKDGSIPEQDISVSLKPQKPDDNTAYLAFWNTVNAQKCDVQGQFHFTALPGRYLVSSFSKTSELVGENPVIEIPSPDYPSLLFQAKKDEKPQVKGIKGRCENPDGQPVANAKVYLLSDPNQVVMSDLDGRFVLIFRPEECKKNVYWKYQENKEQHETNPSMTALRLAEKYGPFYQDPDTDWMGIAAYVIAEDGKSVDVYEISRHREFILAPEPIPATLVLKPAYSITGQAVASSHQPVGGAEVEVIMGNDSFDPESLYKKTVTDPKGRFTVSGLAMKTNYTVRLTTGDGVSCAKHFSAGRTQHGFDRTIEHIYAKNASLVDMGNFILNTKTFEVSGVVVNHLGRPISNALLKLNATAQDIKNAQYLTGADGRFAFEGLFGGPISLWCNVGDDGYASFDTVAGTQGIRMVIDKGVPKEDLGTTLVQSAAVEIAFFDETTKEPILLPEAYISLNQENGSTFNIRLDEGVARFLINPGKVQFELYGTNKQYNRFKKEFVAETYQAYNFRYEITPTEEKKVLIETGPVVYPEVLSETDNDIWNLKTLDGSSDHYRVLEILVIDNEMETPVSDAEVLISFLDGKGRFLGKTNENGKVSFAVFPDIIDCALKSIKCPNYLESLQDKKIPTFYSDITKREFRIKQEMTTVNIVVLDSEGKPASNIWLSHEYFRGDKWERWLDKTSHPTDQNGRLSMRWIYEKGPEPKRLHFISSDHISKKGFVAQVVTAMPGDEIVVQIVPAVRVQGRIVGANGQVVPRISFNFHYRINEKSILGPYAETKENGDYGPIPIAPGFDYQVEFDRDHIGSFGENSFVFIEGTNPLVNLPDCISHSDKKK